METEHDLVPPSTALHLCSGYAGMELALRGLGVRTVCHVERDSYAAAILVERMEEQRLDSAPVWSDLATFDGRRWRGLVDLITAGLPCQPFSAAGAGRGLEDERHLWPHMRRVIEEVQPGYVFLENVPQVISKRWLDHVLADLAEMGFDAEWGCLSAAAVGAPHKRDRFWLVAHRHQSGCGGERLPVGGAFGGAEAEGCCADVAHTNRQERSEVAGGAPGDEGADGREPDGGHVGDRHVEDVADAAEQGLQGRSPAGPPGDGGSALRSAGVDE